MNEARKRIFYGDPDESIEELLTHGLMGEPDKAPPRDGDELCDGHQSHYEWEDGRWT